MMESEIRTALANDAAIQAAVSGRIYVGVAPSGAQVPHLVYWRAADYRPHTMVEDPGVHRARLVLRAHASSYWAARSLAQDIARVLASYSSSTVDRCYVESVMDMVEQSSGLWASIVEAEVWTRS